MTPEALIRSLPYSDAAAVQELEGALSAEKIDPRLSTEGLELLKLELLRRKKRLEARR